MRRASARTRVHSGLVSTGQLSFIAPFLVPKATRAKTGSALSIDMLTNKSITQVIHLPEQGRESWSVVFARLNCVRSASGFFILAVN